MRASLPVFMLLPRPVATAVAACGGGDDSGGGSGEQAAPSEHVHVDGSVRVGEGGFTTTAADGEEHAFGAGGRRTFSIAGADHAAFDPDHLEEHRRRKEPIVVYFEPKAPDTGIAYEDA